MREWRAARQHVQNMKETDPRGAERLNKEITAVSLVFLCLCLCCYFVVLALIVVIICYIILFF